MYVVTGLEYRFEKGAPLLVTAIMYLHKQSNKAARGLLPVSGICSNSGFLFGNVPPPTFMTLFKTY